MPEKQDIVSGQYDFLMREYSPVQGRWWTPDPAGAAGVWPALPGVGLFGAAASPLAPLGPDDVSAESAAAGAEPCAADTGLLASEPGLGSGSGPSGGCAGDAGPQSVAPANNLELGTAISSSAPNPFAAVNPNNPQTWDRYTYVGGNPGELTDPLGLSFWCNSGRWAAVGLGVTGLVVGIATGGVGGAPFAVAGWYLGGVTALACGQFY